QPADRGAPAGAHRAVRQGEPTGRGDRRRREQREVRPVTGRLASKVVVVTGGGTGIGRAVAARAVADGAAVVIAGRRRDAGERAAAELRGSGGRWRVPRDQRGDPRGRGGR